MNFPVFSQLAGNFGGFRDGFARDCLLQRRVNKLSVPLEMMLVEGSIRRVASRDDRAPSASAVWDRAVAALDGLWRQKCAR